MRTIRLYALREDDDSNYKIEWKLHTQFLGSVLLWAFRAGATRIEYMPDRGDPFVYFNADGNPVISEFPQPPDGLRDGMIQWLFIDTIDGHPALRQARRLTRRWLGIEARGTLILPDSDNNVESKWSVVVHDQSATVNLVGTLPYTPSWRAK